MTKPTPKKKVWVAWINEHWRLTSGFSGINFILSEPCKVRTFGMTRKVKITVEEIK